MQDKIILEKRTVSRTRMVIPVRSSSAADTPARSSAVVHTLDLSIFGAKLGAFRQSVKCGDILVVQRQHKRARCKVVWSREVGPKEIHVGIEFLSSEEGFWGVPLKGSDAAIWMLKSEPS
jgi:hypothetical protein